MNEVSTRRRRRFPPKLDRILLDADVNARLLRYLESIGFDVLFAPNVDGVDIHDDSKIVKWARRHRRILVCHDRFKDKQTRIRVYLEVLQNGGKVIRIAGPPQQPLLTSLGKLVVHRDDWLQFFKEHEDGIVAVHMTGMHRRTRDDLAVKLQQLHVDPYEALERLRKRRAGTSRRRQPPAAQLHLDGM